MSKHDYPRPETKGDEITDKYAEGLAGFLEQGRQLTPAIKERLLKALSGQGHLETDQIASAVMESSAAAPRQATTATEAPAQRMETATGSNIEQAILNNLDNADRESNRNPQKFAEFFRNLLPSGYEVMLKGQMVEFIAPNGTTTFVCPLGNTRLASLPDYVSMFTIEGKNKGANVPVMRVLKPAVLGSGRKLEQKGLVSTSDY